MWCDGGFGDGDGDDAVWWWIGMELFLPGSRPGFAAKYLTGAAPVLLR
jgi:hypothetical protein